MSRVNHDPECVAPNAGNLNQLDAEPRMIAPTAWGQSTGCGRRAASRLLHIFSTTGHTATAGGGWGQKYEVD